MSSVLSDLCSDCTCEIMACGRCICLDLAGVSPRGDGGVSKCLRDPSAHGNNCFPSCATS